LLIVAQASAAAAAKAAKPLAIVGRAVGLATSERARARENESSDGARALGATRRD
jgi:hypothetical protein